MPLKTVKGGTIVWGTGNIAGNAIPAGAIIDSIQLTPKNGAPIEIEDNDGLAWAEVVLRDGFNAKVAAIYDDSKTWPMAGGNAALAIAFKGSSANAIPFGEGNGATVAIGVVTCASLCGGFLGRCPAKEKL